MYIIPVYELKNHTEVEKEKYLDKKEQILL